MRKIKFLFAILLISLCALCSCSEKKLPVQELFIKKSDGKTEIVKAEIADTYETRQHGFMERKNIPDGTGMLFIFEKDQVLSFWMKNTPTPLSIAYIDSNGKIRDILDMKPFSLENVVSSVSVRYALEVPQGWFSKVGIKVGDFVDLKQKRQEAPSVQEKVDLEEDLFFFEPESSTLTDKKNPIIKISSSKTGENVYLNGNFQGKTPLTISNLIEGFYTIKVGNRKKSQIQAESFKKNEYFFE